MALPFWLQSCENCVHNKVIAEYHTACEHMLHFEGEQRRTGAGFWCKNYLEHSPKR